jgi:azurin
MRTYVLIAVFVLRATSGTSTVPPTATSVAPRDVFITAGDDMKFSVTTIQARPGEALHVRLKSVATVPKIAMGHNFVLLRAGADPVAILNAAGRARPPDFNLPDLRTQVLAFTSLAGAGETVDVSFTTPDRPGHYVYMCAYPGHVGMRGRLVVK